MPSNDNLARSSVRGIDPPLSRIRQTGFPVRGICSDVWYEGEGPDGDSERDETLSRVVETLAFRESFSRVLSEFEELYWSSGGRTGGW
jgi:hypothetical protein